MLASLWKPLMSIAENQVIRRGEFIALMAMMFATIAFSMDAMLPAIPEIAHEISDGNTSLAAWILTSFIAGMGFGTFFVGPLSDAYGRKPIVYIGAAIYILSALAAWATSSFEWIMIARFLQGLGAAGPRIVSIAVVRDLFKGNEMARIVSISMTIFILVPAIAPAMGALIINSYGWRYIFAAFILFSLISVIWFAVRITEPLEIEDRRPIQMGLLTDAVKQILTHKIVSTAISMQTIMSAMLFSTLAMIQPIYDQFYGLPETFPYWFGAIALISGSSGLLNAYIVIRLGTRTVNTWSISIHIVISAAILIAMTQISGTNFFLFVIWQFFLFSLAGLTVGNLNAIAMEPMGHIAGMAASVTGSISTLIGALIASIIALLFEATPITLITVVMILGAIYLLLMMRLNTFDPDA
jgi:DHA1 family bicyclomycin/chloramphenicol resistance-like MFS transporter